MFGQGKALCTPARARTRASGPKYKAATLPSMNSYLSGFSNCFRHQSSHVSRDALVGIHNRQLWCLVFVQNVKPISVRHAHDIADREGRRFHRSIATLTVDLPMLDILFRSLNRLTSMSGDVVLGRLYRRHVEVAGALIPLPKRVDKDLLLISDLIFELAQVDPTCFDKEPKIAPDAVGNDILAREPPSQ